MFTQLLPFLRLYAQYRRSIMLGILIASITLLASIGLLSLSGYFLAGTAIAGLAATYFNYMLPAAGVRGLAITRTVGRYTERLVSHDTTFRVLARLRTFTFRQLLPLTPSGISQFRRAELLNRLVADIETLDHLYVRLLSPLTSSLLVIVLFTLLLSWFNVQLALILALILSMLFVIIPILFYFAGKSTGKKLTQLRAEYRFQLTAWLQGQAELIMFNALDCFRQQLNRVEQQWQEAQQQQISLLGISQALVMLGAGLTTVLMLWLASALVNQSHLAPSYVALFTFAALAAFETIAPIASAFLHISHVASSAQRVNELLLQQPDITFGEQRAIVKDRAVIQFEQLCFAYPSSQPVIERFSLTIPDGQHLAILGKTGCGKSTLLQLLTRAWQPTSGNILLNGHGIETYSEQSLRQMMTFVPQRIHIFSATLRYNLQIGHHQADDAKLQTVLTELKLNHLLDGEGLNAWIGEGGRSLSGGERRRIGIARALLHQAPLILLDEPTEGLDNATEQDVLSVIKRYSHQKSMIIVTHRLTVLSHVDRALLFDGRNVIDYHPTLL